MVRIEITNLSTLQDVDALRLVAAMKTESPEEIGELLARRGIVVERSVSRGEFTERYRIYEKEDA